jgi:hypothetical protein
MAVCSLPRCGQIAVLFNITLGYSWFSVTPFDGYIAKVNHFEHCLWFNGSWKVAKKRVDMWVGYFPSEFCFGWSSAGSLWLQGLAPQTVGYIVYLSFKMQTALSQPFTGFSLSGIKYAVTRALLSVTNWKLCRFFSCYFGPSLNVTRFERSFFTFLRSFRRMNRLTMRLSTMDGNMPDLMMVPACFRKSPIYWWLYFFPYDYFLSQQRWDKPPESYSLFVFSNTLSSGTRVSDGVHYS